MRWVVLLVMALSMGLAGCKSDGGSDCVDADGDGRGAGCGAGTDCDDGDENNWDACTTCVDVDMDGSFVACNQYLSIAGPDCDDADIDNQTSCSSCLDGDVDGAFVGCDAYTVRMGPDCDDADVDNQTSCSTCLDDDGDSSFAGCDAYATRLGPDCDDANPNSFANCSSCVDADLDLSFLSCDAYTTVSGPDCDDGDPLRGSLEPELADDGIDNDCSGTDLVAATETTGIFVDVSNPNCTNSGTAGSQATPYCSLSVALASATAGGNLFVAAGSYPVVDRTLTSVGRVGVYGGYDSSWSRNLASNTTTITTTGMLSRGFFFNGLGLILDGFSWSRASSVSGQVYDLEMRTQDFSALTRTDFTMPMGSSANVVFTGAPGQQQPSVDGLVRDVVYRGTNTTRVLLARNLETFRVENSEFDIRTGASAFVIEGVANAREFVINNTFYSDYPSNLIVSAAEKTYVVGNSIDLDNALGRGGLVLRSAEVVVVNNAYRTQSLSQFLTVGSFSQPAFADLTLLNNIAVNNPAGDWGINQGNGMNDQWADAAAANLCTSCLMAGGNQEQIPGFANPSIGDFALSPSSVATDAGTDPTSIVPYFRVALDRDGTSRPLDGDGMNGPQWDAGAIEN